MASNMLNGKAARELLINAYPEVSKRRITRFAMDNRNRYHDGPAGRDSMLTAFALTLPPVKAPRVTRFTVNWHGMEFDCKHTGAGAAATIQVYDETGDRVTFIRWAPTGNGMEYGWVEGWLGTVAFATVYELKAEAVKSALAHWFNG